MGHTGEFWQNVIRWRREWQTSPVYLLWETHEPAVKKSSGCDGIPVELFKTVKDDAIKVLHSICQQIWKTHQWPQDWKRSILILIPKKGSTKDVLTIRQLHSSPMLVRSMLKILHARLQHYVNQGLQDVQAGFRRRRGTRDQIAAFVGS